MENGNDPLDNVLCLSKNKDNNVEVEPSGEKSLSEENFKITTNPIQTKEIISRATPVDTSK